MPQNLIAKYTGLNVGTSSDEFAAQYNIPKNKVAEYYDNAARQTKAEIEKKYDKSITDYIANGEYKKATGAILNSIAESTPVTISLMVGGYAGVSPLVTTMGGGAVFGAEKKSQLDKEAPFLDNVTKTSNALSTGLFEGIFENYGLTKLGGMVSNIFKKEGEKAAVDFAKKSFREVYSPLVKKYLGVAAEEPISEMETQFAQNVVDKYSGFKPDLDLKEGVVEAGLIGLSSAGVYTSPVAMLDLYTTGKARKKALELNVKKQMLENDIANKNTPDEVKEVISNEIAATNKEMADLREQDSFNAKGIEVEEKSKVVENWRKIDALNESISKGNLSDDAKKIVEQKIATLESENEGILAKYEKPSTETTTQPQQALEKYTASTPEKYGYIDRGDGKGKIELTEEEFLAEQAKMQPQGEQPIVEKTQEDIDNENKERAKYGLEPLKPTYRGTTQQEWEAVKNGQPFKSKTGFGDNEANVTWVSDKKEYSEEYVNSNENGVLVEFKPEAIDKSGVESGQENDDTGVRLGKNLTLEDVARVTDKNGNVIYEAESLKSKKPTEQGKEAVVPILTKEEKNGLSTFLKLVEQRQSESDYQKVDVNKLKEAYNNLPVSVKGFIKSNLVGKIRAYDGGLTDSETPSFSNQFIPQLFGTSKVKGEMVESNLGTIDTKKLVELLEANKVKHNIGDSEGEVIVLSPKYKKGAEKNKGALSDFLDILDRMMEVDTGNEGKDNEIRAKRRKLNDLLDNRNIYNDLSKGDNLNDVLKKHNIDIPKEYLPTEPSKQKEDEQKKPTKENGKPMPEGVQGVRTEGQGGQESTELRSEQEEVNPALKDVESTAKLEGYHYTDKDFSEFEQPTETQSLGNGVYFYLNKRSSNKKEVKADLSVKKILDWKNLSEDERNKLAKELESANIPSERLNNGKLVKKEFDSIEEAKKYTNGKKSQGLNVKTDLVDGKYVVEYKEKGLSTASNDVLRGLAAEFDPNIAKRLGYDAAKLGDEIVVFDAKNTKIKSESLLSKEQTLKTEKNEKEPTKTEDGKPLSEGVQGVRTEGQGGQESTELRSEQEEVNPKEKLWSKIRTYNNLSKKERSDAFGSKLRSDIMSEAAAIKYTIKPTKQGKYILIDNKGKQVKKAGTPRSKDVIQEEKRLKERRSRARRELPQSVKHSIAQDIANGIKFDRESLKKVSGLRDNEIPFWMTRTDGKGVTLEFYNQMFQEKGGYYVEDDMNFQSEVADAIADFAFKNGRTSALEFIEKQQELIENGGFTDEEIKEQAEMLQAELDEANFDYFGEYLSNLSDEEAQLLADELREAEKQNNQSQINEILNESENKREAEQGEQEANIKASNIKGEGETVKSLEEKLKSVESKIAKKQSDIKKLTKDNQADMFAGAKVEMFDNAELLKDLTNEIKDLNQEASALRAKIEVQKEKESLVEQPENQLEIEGLAPTEEKVSGGLTEAEKTNLESVAKDAGVNFQEVRNVYNKHGEGKPLSEITLEDYKKAEEKRGKSKEENPLANVESTAKALEGIDYDTKTNDDVNSENYRELEKKLPLVYKGGEDKSSLKKGFFSIDKSEAEAYAEGENGKVRSALINPNAKVLRMVDSEGNIIQSAVDEYERITKSKFPLEGVTETLWGNTETKKLLKNAGYDGVYSFGIDGEVFVAITDKATVDANPKSISESYHAAKAKPENTRTEQEQQLVKAVEELLTPKTTQNAVQVKSATKEVPYSGEGGKNKPESSEGVGQGKQGQKAAEQSVQEGQIDINGYKFTDTPSLRTGISVEKIDTPANVIEADVFVSDKKNVLQQGATRLENGWIKFMQTTDGNTYLYNENSGETVLLKSEKGGIMGIVENDFVKNNPREKQSAQKEIDNLFDAYDSIEESKGMDKRKAAEEFRNMQESIKNPTLKRIFDNIKDIHSQLEKQGLITKTKGCP